jgi:hypothetical protein
MKGMVICNIFVDCEKTAVFVSISLPKAKRRAMAHLIWLTCTRKARLEEWADHGRLDGGHEMSVGVEVWNGVRWEREGGFYATLTVLG